MLFLLKLNPEFSSLLLEEAKAAIALFFFVSCGENSYYRAVSVGQLSFDCRSYTRICLLSHQEHTIWMTCWNGFRNTNNGSGTGIWANDKVGNYIWTKFGLGIELASPSADHLSTEWTCLRTLGKGVTRGGSWGAVTPSPFVSLFVGKQPTIFR